MRLLIQLSVILILSSILGCVTGGSNIKIETLRTISIGKTTKTDIITIFGQPDVEIERKTIDNIEFEIITYVYIRLDLPNNLKRRILRCEFRNDSLNAYYFDSDFAEAETYFNENGQSYLKKDKSTCKDVLNLFGIPSSRAFLPTTLNFPSGPPGAEEVWRYSFSYPLEFGTDNIYKKEFTAFFEKNDTFIGLKSSEKSDINSILTVINRGADVNLVDIKGRTALIWASEEGNLGMVRGLIIKGADVNKKGYESSIPLPVFSTNYETRTPLSLAAENGHSEVAKYLIENGASIDNYTLRLAAASGNLETAKCLLSHITDINKLDKYGWSILGAAAQACYPDMVKFLIEKGAKVNILDKQGNTPLIMALDGRASYAATALAADAVGAGGAAPENREKFMRIIANESVNKGPTVKVLIDNGADFNAIDAQGRPIIMKAASNHLIGIIEILLKNGVNIDQKSEHGETTLWRMISLFSDHKYGRYKDYAPKDLEVIRFLIKNGADVNATNKQGVSLFRFSKNLNLNEVVELLLSAGAK